MFNAVSRFFDDFLGTRTILATASNSDSPWSIADTSVAGTPTYTGVASESSGAVKLLLASNSEAENVCLCWGDILGLKWDNVKRITFRLKATAITTAEQLTFGLWSARNDTVDSVAYNTHFSLHASTGIDCESDDATTDNDDKSTGLTLAAATYRQFVIDFANGLSDVRFFVENASGKMQRVCAATTFSVAQATGTYCQPVVQLQKASGTTVPSVTIDYVEIEYIRS